VRDEGLLRGTTLLAWANCSGRFRRVIGRTRLRLLEFTATACPQVGASRRVQPCSAPLALCRAHTSLSRLAVGWLTTPDVAFL